jgi:hypothetical protein
MSKLWFINIVKIAKSMLLFADTEICKNIP